MNISHPPQEMILFFLFFGGTLFLVDDGNLGHEGRIPI
jgi:hypothetical protein